MFENNRSSIKEKRSESLKEFFSLYLTRYFSLDRMCQNVLNK